LNSTRTSGFGFSAITYSEMKAYFDLYQIDVQEWEVQVIKMFDSVALEVARKKQDKEQKKKK